MDIGSGKPSKDEMKRVRHHLIDVVDPDYAFTAGEFSMRATSAAEEISSAGRYPMVVGGTGFYVNSMLSGIDEIPDIDESVKAQVSAEYDSSGPDSVYDELKQADPVFSLKVHKNDRQRVIRGLSVFRATGRPISDYYLNGSRETRFEILYIGLGVEKEELTERISVRVDSMFKNGLVEEVEKLRSMGYSPSLNSMQSIGYSEVNSFLDGKVSHDDTVVAIKQNTVKYAKKQMTWFKKNKGVIWFSPDKIKTIPDLIKGWLN